MANVDHLVPPTTPPTVQAQEKEVQLAGVGGRGKGHQGNAPVSPFLWPPTKGKPHPSSSSIWGSFWRLVVSTVTKGEGLLVDKLLPHPPPQAAPSLWPPALTSVFLGFP